MMSRTLSALAGHGGNASPLAVTLLLAAACASASLIFACATPFAAFAVIAAALLPLRHAVATMIVVWLVNQAIGFGVLNYPQTANSAAWGIAIGVAAVAGTAVASRMFRSLARLGRFAIYPLALLAAFAVYELGLFAVTPLLGGAESFTVQIVGNIAFTNAVWLAGLVALVEIARSVTMAGQQATR